MKKNVVRFKIWPLFVIKNDIFVFAYLFVKRLNECVCDVKSRKVDFMQYKSLWSSNNWHQISQNHIGTKFPQRNTRKADYRRFLGFKNPSRFTYFTWLSHISLLERNSQKSEPVRRWRSGSDFVISVYRKDYKIGATLKRGS